jgi:hypothetical protein
MNARELISKLGGTHTVIAETGLSKGRISQWQTSNHIPRPWVKYLRARFPRTVDWSQLDLAPSEQQGRASQAAV